MMATTAGVARSRPKWTFALGWFCANAITFAIAGALLHNFPLAFHFPLSIEGMRQFEFGPAAVGALFGAVPAFFMGVVQRLVLHSYLSIPRWWVISTMLGVGLLHFLSDGFPDAQDLSLAVFASGVVVGLCQWLLLRGNQAFSRWWAGASLAGWYLGWVAGLKILDGLGLLNIPWRSGLDFQQHGLLGMVMGITYSICTVAILIGLWRRPER